jgi:psiF repeat-containing protein
MKKLLTLSLLSLFVSGGAYAAADATTPQQDKMKACNARAGDMKGDERKAYMKTCLSAKKPESKMAMCNKKTAGLKGDERSKAQSECMKAA